MLVYDATLLARTVCFNTQWRRRSVGVGIRHDLISPIKRTCSAALATVWCSIDDGPKRGSLTWSTRKRKGREGKGREGMGWDGMGWDGMGTMKHATHLEMLLERC